MIVFKHIRNTRELYVSTIIEPKGGMTIAIELPKASLLKDVKIGDKLHTNMGVAKCHEDDLYNKKVGAELASSRLGNWTFNVDDITDAPDGGKYLWLQIDGYMALTLVVREDKEYPRLL